jgi:hypothetical protein
MDGCSIIRRPTLVTITLLQRIPAIVEKMADTRNILLMVSFLMFCPNISLAAASDTREAQKADSSHGLTLDDIGRGLKSAAKNIGDEIPKIGPAIGDTFKKVTGQDKEKETKKSSPQSSKDKNNK